jgi:hypothetical protein
MCASPRKAALAATQALARSTVLESMARMLTHARTTVEQFAMIVLLHQGFAYWRGSLIIRSSIAGRIVSAARASQ